MIFYNKSTINDKSDSKMNIILLLQAIRQVTDYQISFMGKDFILNGERLRFRDDIIFIGDTKIRTIDPKRLLYELKSEKVLRINSATINNILKVFHKLEWDARKGKNKTIQTVFN